MILSLIGENQMPIFKVMLMNKRTFQGKEVNVQANDKKGAEKKAINIQQISGQWVAMTCKVNDAQPQRFKHKGVAYHVRG